MKASGKYERYSLFTVTGDHDKTEGRGGTYLVGYTLTRHEAEALAKGHGCMGCPGYIREEEIVVLDGQAFVLGSRSSFPTGEALMKRILQDKLALQAQNLSAEKLQELLNKIH